MAIARLQAMVSASAWRCCGERHTRRGHWIKLADLLARDQFRHASRVGCHKHPGSTHEGLEAEKRQDVQEAIYWLG
jgi:hypothetical protein